MAKRKSAEQVETEAILNDPKTMEAIEEGLTDIKEGNVEVDVTVDEATGVPTDAMEPDRDQVWEDPPVVKRGRQQFDWTPIHVELLSNPGQWLRVRTSDKKAGLQAAVVGLRKGTYPLPEGEFEYRVAKREDGSYGMWARAVK